MGFFDRLKKRLKRKPQPSMLQTELKELGIRAVKDERLEQRIDLLTDLHDFIEEPLNEEDSPEDKVEQIYIKLHMVTGIMRKVSVPYGRGGDKYYYGVAMQGWEKLYAIGNEYVKYIGDRIRGSISTTDKGKVLQDLKDFVKGEDDKKIVEAVDLFEQVTSKFNAPLSYVDKDNLIKKLDGFIHMEVLRYALLIIDRSWFIEDVQPQLVLAVQQALAPLQYPPTTLTQPRELDVASKQRVQDWGAPKQLEEEKQ